MARRLYPVVLALVAAAMVFVPRAPAEEDSAPTEYRVKAAWLLNFARFVDWPAEALGTTNSPIVVGVVGQDPFGADLDKTLKGVTVKGRAFVVRRLTADPEAKLCHVLFLSSSEKKRHRELLDNLKGAPVLTVGETDEFIQNGGVIGFVRKENTVRFGINLDAAGPARLKISANLLKVAFSVKGRYATE